jgi:hypothetical protein
MAQFMRDRESLAIWMMQRVDPNDRNSVLDVNHPGQFHIERSKPQLDTFLFGYPLHWRWK